MKRKIALLILILLCTFACIISCSDETPCETHTYGEWNVVSKATCTSEGSKKRICTECNASETDVIEAKGHSFSDWSTSTAPTCMSQGVKSRTCSECQESENSPIDILPHISVTNFDELKAAIATKEAIIRIDADITLGETLYVTEKTIIYANENHTLKRSATFIGDLFVLGEDAAGNNIVLSEKLAQLTVKTENNAVLKIDGNKSEMALAVSGSAFFLANSSVLNIYDGVELLNHKKTLNSRINENKTYFISEPLRVGGPAVLITNGTFNMYGGLISGCEVNPKDSGNTDEADRVEGYNASSCGGAVYNYGTFNMYAGTISNNTAARGGAIYNYRTANLYGGTIKNNVASVYGGAMYMTDSQYTYAVLGEEGTNIKLSFISNSSTKSGGAIFAAHQSTIAILGATLFDGNSTESNGGAINLAGELMAKYVVFKNNRATSKGGAVYAYYGKEGYTPRVVRIDSGLFEANESPRGGAMYFGASDDMLYGAIGKIKNVVFNQNTAPIGTKYGHGAAVYVYDNAIVTMENITATNNQAETYGGFAYASGKGSLTLTNITATGNSAPKGGVIYLTTTGTTVTINGGVFSENTATDGGESVYSNSTGAILNIKKNSLTYPQGTITGKSGFSITEID